MLATQVKEPFQRPGWVYEEKYDGYRLLAYKEGRRVTLLSRAAHDRTRTFPDIKAAVAGLKPHTLLLDGEIVAFDRNHVSRFQLLQDGDAVPVYAVFDCLYIDGHDLRKTPLTTRRAHLETAVSRTAHTFLARRLAQDGLAAYRAAKRKGFEGIIAKESSSSLSVIRGPQELVRISARYCWEHTRAERFTTSEKWGPVFRARCCFHYGGHFNHSWWRNLQ